MAQDELAVSKNYHHLTGRERMGYAGSHFAVLEFPSRTKHNMTSDLSLSVQ